MYAVSSFFCQWTVIYKQKYKSKTVFIVCHKRGPEFLSYEGPSIETLDLFCEYFSSTPTL